MKPDHSQNFPSGLRPYHSTNLQEIINIATTSISFPDGKKGQLFYRGYPIDTLAKESHFFECAFLLMYGFLPSLSQLTEFENKIRVGNSLPEQIFRAIKELPRSASSLRALQQSFAMLNCFTEPEEEFTNFSSLCLKTIALTPTIIAYSYRHSIGMPPIHPKDDLSFIENFFYMVSGKVPEQKFSRLLEVALILQMDLGLNPSTLTARTIASTQASVYSSISGAIGALSGPLYEGASEKVFHMLETAVESSDVSSFLGDQIKNGHKIMGMGHSIYKTIDPRAKILKNIMLENFDLSEDIYFRTLNRIENYANTFFLEQDKKVFVNMDFWIGLLYKNIGFSHKLFSSIFAIARVIGWVAHIMEQRSHQVTYNFDTKYYGSYDLKYIPIKER